MEDNFFLSTREQLAQENDYDNIDFTARHTAKSI